MVTLVDFCYCLLLLIIVLALYWYLTIPAGLPPGSAGLPIFGYLPFLNKHVYRTLSTLGKKYGNLYYLYFGNQLIIVLNDYDTIKEALIYNGAAFAGRPPVFGTQNSAINVENLGISATEGDFWQQHRRFILTKMKDFGILKNDDQILDEVNFLIHEMKQTSGRPFDVKLLLTKSLTNIAHMFILGRRLDYHDPLFNQSLYYLDELVRMIPTLGLFLFFPWLHRFSAMKKLAKIPLMINISNSWLVIINELLAEAKKAAAVGQSDNYVQAYSTHQHELKSNANNNPIFTDAVLSDNMRDLIGASGETSATTLLWGLIYMTKYPDIQKKVQTELDEIFGHDKKPTWSCRNETPYTEATLQEIHRIVSLSPMSVQRRTLKETVINGYRIPAKALVFPMLYSVHYDPKIWGDPQNFRPERFIDAGGHYIHSKYVIPFALGKRSCVGEQLAKMEMYLFFASLMLNFDFVPPDGIAPSLEVNPTLVRMPASTIVCAQTRSV